MYLHGGVPKSNRGTSKSVIFIYFHRMFHGINHPAIGVPPIFGNLQMELTHHISDRIAAVKRVAELRLGMERSPVIAGMSSPENPNSKWVPCRKNAGFR